jgi:hypothetical protein
MIDQAAALAIARERYGDRATHVCGETLSSFLVFVEWPPEEILGAPTPFVEKRTGTLREFVYPAHADAFADVTYFD